MDTIRLCACKFASALWLLILAAAMLSMANAQEQQHKREASTHDD